MSDNNLGRKPRSIEKSDRNAELERLLVEGEMVDGDDGKQRRAYPLGKDIAERLGVSNAWVSKYAKAHQCVERRRALQRAAQERAQQKLAEMDANRITFDLDRQLSLCDNILEKYRDAIEQRGIGNVTAADINAMIRLRHFIGGNADSRVETQQHTVTLEMMQEAHARLRGDQEQEREGLGNSSRTTRLEAVND